VAPPVFKTGLAGNTLAGRFDSFPPPPQFPRVFCERVSPRARIVPATRGPSGFSSAPHLQSLKHPAPKSWQPHHSNAPEMPLPAGP
jgi:hypothetical protein